MNCKRPLMLMTMTAAAHAAGQAPPGYALAPGFPVSTQITNWNGGMMVNLDADPELEFVASAGPEIWAFNIDGSVVSGWPVFTGDPSFGPPSWGDVDGDGENEIVFTTFFFGLDALLIVLEKDGSVAPGFPVVVSGAFKSNSLADLDGDGDDEILINGNDGSGLIEAYQGNGNPVSGFPFNLGDITSGATVSTGDIDQDGKLELIAMSFSELYVLEEDGSLDPNFPNPWSPPDSTHGFNSYAAASLVDFDGDGDLEIVFHTAIRNQNPGGINTAPTIHVLHHDGTPMTGWPQDLPIPNIDQLGGGATAIQAPLSVADIDNDNSLDIVVGDVTLCPDDCTVVMAWDQSGTPKSGFPITGIGATQMQVMIADIDGDGTMELFKDNNKAANPNESFNHDGTPLAGWEFPNHDGYGQMEFGDIDNDGFMDFIAPVNNATTVVQTNRFFLYKSTTVPYSPESAPVGTYMYNYKRNGQVFFSPTDCRADVNGDGQVTPTDFSAWINAYNNNLPECDQNGDNQCTPTDFSAWINNYNAGC